MSDKIFGEKDGDPVEVYPVWNDEYLKNIRIDEKYLKGIILQSRGKLKGNYYIITPETCTVVGDTTMKNSAGNDVHFKMLKFSIQNTGRCLPQFSDTAAAEFPGKC